MEKNLITIARIQKAEPVTIRLVPYKYTDWDDDE